MAAQTGRTVAKHLDFYLDDSGGTLRQIIINSINGVGLDYDEADLTAFQDALHGVLLGHANSTIEITGPFDNTATTGSHSVLSGVIGGSTPLSLDVRVGIRQAYQAGEPQFGITSTSANGYLCKSYMLNSLLKNSHLSWAITAQINEKEVSRARAALHPAGPCRFPQPL